MTTLNVNGTLCEVEAALDTPLLYVLRGELGVTSPRFGCGMAQCGACSVLLDGVEVRSCITPVSDVAGRHVVTVEGLPGRWAEQNKLVETGTLHPVQQAWIDEQVPQCGYCQFGMMIKATELLENNSDPSPSDILEAYTTSGPSPHLCRCGSYKAIFEGVRRASDIITGKAP